MVLEGEMDADGEMRLSDIEGLFVGGLRPHELQFFNDECRAGRAMRSYDGPSGLLGLAKVRKI